VGYWQAAKGADRRGWPDHGFDLGRWLRQGENALYFAKLGHKVMGIDFLSEPISRATQKATERGLTATFMVMDDLMFSDGGPKAWFVVVRRV
jgi:hypothetical protein